MFSQVMHRLAVLLKRPSAALFIFIGVSLVSGLIYIKITPLLWGMDEISHFARVYQLSEGHLRASKIPTGEYGGQLATNLAALNAYANHDLTTAGVVPIIGNRSDVDSRQAYDRLGANPFNKRTGPFIITAAAYSPLAYPGALVGLTTARLLHFDIGNSIFMTRLCTLFFYVALVSLAIRLLRGNKFRWLVFVLALLPEAIFQASMVSVDSVSIAESLLLFAVLIRLWEFKGKSPSPRPRKLLILLAVLAFALPLTKPNYYFLLLPILGLPAAIWKARRTEWVYKLGTLLVAGALVLGWSYLTRNIILPVSSNIAAMGLNISAKGQASYAVHHPIAIGIGLFNDTLNSMDTWAQSFCGLLGRNMFAVPLAVPISVALVTVAILYVRGAKALSTRFTLILFVSGLLTLLSVIGTFWLFYTPVASTIILGVQGRYFLPAAVYISMAALAIANGRIRLLMSEYVATVVFVAGSSGLLAIATVFYYAALY